MNLKSHVLSQDSMHIALGTSTHMTLGVRIIIPLLCLPTLHWQTNLCAVFMLGKSGSYNFCSFKVCHLIMIHFPKVLRGAIIGGWRKMLTGFYGLHVIFLLILLDVPRFLGFRATEALSPTMQHKTVFKQLTRKITWEKNEWGENWKPTPYNSESPCKSP